MNNRSKYIDIYKGFLMILVIIGHLHFFDYNSRTLTLIYSFHMPAFLIVAGYLSHINNNSTFKEIFVKRFKSTIIPYIIFTLISLILLPRPTIAEQQMAILSSFKGIGDPINSVNLPLWFLTYYFISMVLFEVFDLICIKFSYMFTYKINLFKLDTNNNQKLLKNILLLILVMISMFISYRYARVYKLMRLPFNFEIAMFSLLYVYIGKICSEYSSSILNIFGKIKKNKLLTILSVIIYLVIVFLWYNLSLKNGRIDLNARDYKNAMYMYINSILGFITFMPVIYIISVIKYVNSIFAFFGKISIYILAFHIPSNIVTYGIINSFMPMFILTRLYNTSIIGIIYLTTSALIFCSFMFFCHLCIKSIITDLINKKNP